MEAWNELKFGERTFFPVVRKLEEMKEVVFDKRFLHGFFLAFYKQFLFFSACFTLYILTSAVLNTSSKQFDSNLASPFPS